jgi:hypothetical protein
MGVRLLSLTAMAGALVVSILAGSATAESNSGRAASRSVEVSTDLLVNSSVTLAASSSRTLDVASMMPGDVLAVPVTVTNPRLETVRYGIRSRTSENMLAAQLDVTVAAVADGASCTAAPVGRGAALLYGPGDLGSTAGTDLVGSSAMLAGGGQVTLCLRVSLPLDTGNDYAGLTSGAQFDFRVV